MNQYSALGVDPEFGKGNEEIDREIGDPKHKPNPCLGPVEKAPFYAIKIYPGDGSTTVGLKIDEHCRSEEHTSELQSLMRISYAVFCLKKKKHKTTHSKHKHEHGQPHSIHIHNTTTQ